MKKIISYTLSIAFICLTLSSCLKSGLEGIEDFHDAELTNMQFEYRWAYSQPSATPDGPPVEQLATQQLSTTVVFDEDGYTLNCTITVPAANGIFTAEEREKVTLAQIVGMATISTAATIKPLNGAPELGKRGDFSAPVKFLVTAADGHTSKEYQLVCTMIK